jgi:competence protein ComEA
MKQWLERYRGILFVFLMVVLLAAVVVLQLLRPAAHPIILATATPSPSSETTPIAHPLRVYVSGAVSRPDVYTLPPDSIVKDAMMAAGGPTENADLDRINLASPVSDGQHVYVPRLGEVDPPLQPPSDQSAPGRKININTADLATLDTLPGIGPVIAQRILDHRQANGPFDRIEGMMDVPGIGEGTFEKIKDLITTE